MTYRTKQGLVIGREDAMACALCGKVAECRPYGPNGEQVCFDCGMLDEAAAKRAFSRLLDGPSVVKPCATCGGSGIGAPRRSNVDSEPPTRLTLECPACHGDGAYEVVKERSINNER